MPPEEQPATGELRASDGERAAARAGVALTIRVPDGVRIERSGFSLMGGDGIARFDGPAPGDDAPVVHIRSFNLMGGNSVKPSKRREPSRGRLRR